MGHSTQTDRDIDDIIGPFTHSILHDEYARTGWLWLLWKTRRRSESAYIRQVTIANKFAYVQTEILNFTFAWKADIVYFDAECWVLM